PLIFMTEEENVLRADVAEVTITKQDALSNAPVKDSDYFKVPRVVDKG
ncbi:MAG: Asp-tRNA(Asn)/Glu-tRNA(Gln) amidotransferase GatCAB subunit C, partial [Flavobacteriales bacterium]|nr:Asp-tRNA(Asn)/Glu-tRNA(Gln) amidotransferase GatCAB subunit C [Flavobacteriales bacterium]